MAAIGDAGVATFVIDTEVDASLVMTWVTDIRKTESGLEQRSSSFVTQPQRKFQFSSVLDEAQQRLVLATLARESAAAPIFLLGLSYEALPVKASTSSTIVFHSLSLCDWAVDGQRIAVRGKDGTIATTWIDGAPSGATIATGSDVSAVALEGASVMPLMQVVLDPSQGFPRYQKNATRWTLTAYAQRFRYGASASPGVGASVTTYDAMPVWDRGLVANGTRDEGLASGYDIINAGGGISALAHMEQADWPRQFIFASSRFSERQWFKKFLDNVRGRRVAFLARTGRPDLIAVGDASSGTLTIDSSAQSYIDSWYPSLAHRRLAIVLDDGSVNYRTVESTSGGGSTEDLVLDSSLSGTIARVEFLETVRLDTDEVTVGLGERGWRSELPAIVVQQ